MEPDGRGIATDLSCRDQPSEGLKLLRISYRLADHPWVGVKFLLDNSLEPKRTFDLFKELRASRGNPIVLRFQVRSKDGAAATFRFGGGAKDSCQFGKDVDAKKFSSEWETVEIDLTDEDISSVHIPLRVGLTREDNADLDKPVVRIDVDNIYFTRVAAASAEE
jgi:hypothetical protein